MNHYDFFILHSDDSEDGMEALQQKVEKHT